MFAVCGGRRAVRPVGEPGAAVSPGTRTSSRSKAPALTAIEPLVPVFEAPATLDGLRAGRLQRGAVGERPVAVVAGEEGVAGGEKAA